MPKKPRHNTSRLLYGLLVALILLQGAWWVVYLIGEGSRYERVETARLEALRREAEVTWGRRTALGDAGHAVADSAEAGSRRPFAADKTSLDAGGRVVADSAGLSVATPVLADGAGLVAGPAAGGRAVTDSSAQSASFKERYPELRLQADGKVVVDPDAVALAHQKATRRNRMFLYEGIFFLALLAAGTWILDLAHRSESRYRRARELFLAGVTHEFRTPLSALQLQAETLARDDLPETARQAILPRMLTEIGRIETLVDQVLEAGREDPLDQRLFSRLDAGEETRRVLEEMHDALEKDGAIVETEIGSGFCFLGTSRAFATALRNLIQNAAKHSPRPATIEIRVGGDDSRVNVSVRDDGPGIAREHHERIFESFARLEPADRARIRGAGLGLYLAKRNVEGMGGAIGVFSEPGRGSTFTISLPRVKT